jgi:hypothetical protein
VRGVSNGLLYLQITLSKCISCIGKASSRLAQCFEVVSTWMVRVTRAGAVTPSSIYSQDPLADQRQCASNALLKSARCGS